MHLPTYTLYHHPLSPTTAVLPLLPFNYRHSQTNILSFIIPSFHISPPTPSPSSSIMAKRDHSLAMADTMSPHFTPPQPTGYHPGWQYLSMYSYSYRKVGLNPSKTGCLCGSCCPPTEPQSKYRCIGGRRADMPISISSSESDWSTAPHQLSVRDGSKVDSPGMTLKIGDALGTGYPLGYRPAPQDEALVGCGAWQDGTSHATLAMSFDEAMSNEEPSASQKERGSSLHRDGKS